jgi:hypothetical protein
MGRLESGLGLEVVGFKVWGGGSIVGNHEWKGI